MNTQEAMTGPGSIEAPYTARERSIVTALTRLRCVETPDPDVKARARDALMLILTAEHAADEQDATRASHASMAS
jgi:hypothetical protein